MLPFVLLAVIPSLILGNPIPQGPDNYVDANYANGPMDYANYADYADYLASRDKESQEALTTRDITPKPQPNPSSGNKLCFSIISKTII